MAGNFRSTVALTIIIGVAAAYPARAADPSARILLERAVTAQGGEKELQGGRIVEWQLEGYRNMVEQSERPQGPYIPELQKVREIHDFGGGRFGSFVEVRVPFAYNAQAGFVSDGTTSVRFAGRHSEPGNADMTAMAGDLLSMSPERLLLTALRAPDLRSDHPVQMQSLKQDVAKFTLNGSPITLYLNHFTHLPTAVDYAGPAARQGYWRSIGDVTMRVYYSNWWRGAGGVRLPLQWDIYRNGLHDSTLVASAVRWDVAADPMLTISPDLHNAYLEQAGAQARPPKIASPQEVAPGVTFLPGPWNVAIVRQNDGLLVFEAPISSDYSEQIIALTRKLYPGVRIKGVVSTSDAWPHVAGIRPYVARGIPIYALALNQQSLNSILTASYASRPDELQRRPRKPLLTLVNGKTIIGSGANAVELYPLRGEVSERQMMAYLPAQKLLYGSDSFQNFSAPGSAEAVSEIIDAVERESLHPTRFFMMHIRPTEWRQLLEGSSATHPAFPTGATN